MQGKEGNQRRQGNQDEERQTGNAGHVPDLWDQDVQDW